MKVFALIILLLIPASVKADTLDFVTNVSIGSNIILQTVDMNLTTFIIAKNLGKEANPVFIPFASNPVASGIVKSGVAVGISALMLHFKRDNKVVVLISSLAINGLYSYVVYHNGQIAKGHY